MNEEKTVQLVRVRFPGQSKPGIFRAGKEPLAHGQKVVAMSERGLTIGFINSQIYEIPYKKELGKLPDLKKTATAEDELFYKKVYQEQKKARGVFEQLVSKHNLPMKLEDIEYVSQGKKIIFSYFSPERVDFRNLLKDLSQELRCKIELRQIYNSLKNCKIGPCGPELCLFINSLIDNPAKKACNPFYCCLDGIEKEKNDE